MTGSTACPTNHRLIWVKVAISILPKRRKQQTSRCWWRHSQRPGGGYNQSTGNLQERLLPTNLMITFGRRMATCIITRMTSLRMVQWRRQGDKTSDCCPSTADVNHNFDDESWLVGPVGADRGGWEGIQKEGEERGDKEGEREGEWWKEIEGGREREWKIWEGETGGEKHREGGRERVKVGCQNHNNINRPRYCHTWHVFFRQCITVTVVKIILYSCHK